MRGSRRSRVHNQPHPGSVSLLLGHVAASINKDKDGAAVTSVPGQSTL